MVERKTRWQLAIWNEELEQLAIEISKQLSIPNLVAKLLIQRGYRDRASIEAFLYGTSDQLHDPYKLAGMKEAVLRINHALQQNEKVRIYGDYDADGVSSTSLLYYTFERLGLNFDYYIPHRMLEGYGLNKAAIDKAKEDDITLIVTVDTGISAYEEVQYASSLGIDIVVTDHHEPPELLPQAVAVVNPKQEHCSYPFKGLAGVGVAFKLATALLNTAPMEWSGIVALGTIADLMPLEGENRVLVSCGLQQLRKGEHIGFNALAEASGVSIEELTATNVGFGLAPRINAAGRLEHAGRAVQLLVTSNKQEAEQLASELDMLNKERQQIVEDIFIEAEQQWLDKVQQAESNKQQEPNVIVVAGKGWNVGVIGIVASKLLERYYKPVLVFGIDEQNGTAKGSARSIDNFDLHAALTECEDLLLHFGGHQAAAGMTLHAEKLGELEQRLSNLAEQWLAEEDWIPKLTIDIACELADINLETISQLALLEPFGMSNPSPRVLITGARLSERRAIGKDGKHLKLQLKEGMHQLDVIGFGMGEYEAMLQPNTSLQVVGELSINEWNSIRKPQLQLFDLHVEKERIKVFPSREQFGIIYQYIRKQGVLARKGMLDRLQAISGLGAAEVQLIIDVFEELQFITATASHIEAVAFPQKRELSSSVCYIRAQLQFQQAQA